MLNINASFFQHIVRVRLNICPISQQVSECPMQRTMLTAVSATDKRTIAPRHFMKFLPTYHLNVFCLHCKTLVAI